MARPPDVRVYPLEPLQQAHGAPLGHLAELFGVNRRSLHRWRHEGLTVDQADRFATAIGVHPAEIWPTWIDDHLTVLDRMFVEEGGDRADWLQREAVRG